eukprot:scaffold60566_cov35-Prasinocladus_malaysianus.AAC.1
MPPITKRSVAKARLPYLSAALQLLRRLAMLVPIINPEKHQSMETNAVVGRHCIMYVGEDQLDSCRKASAGAISGRGRASHRPGNLVSGLLVDAISEPRPASRNPRPSKSLCAPKPLTLPAPLPPSVC